MGNGAVSVLSRHFDYKSSRDLSFELGSSQFFGLRSITLVVMSLDLLKEFGPQSQNPQDSPWAGTVRQRPEDKENVDDNDFGDFEVPNDPTTAWKQDTGVVGEKYPCAKVAGVGGLMDISDGSYIHTPSFPFKESGADTEPGDPKSLFERRPQAFEMHTSLFEGRITVFEKRTEDQPTSMNALQPQNLEVDLISENSSALEELGDQDRDDFEGHPVPPAAGKRNTLHETLRTEYADPKRRSTKHSGSSSSPLGLPEQNTIFTVDPDNSDALKSPRLSKIGHLQPAPSNIPPPSILLLLVENLFQCLPMDTKKTISLTDISDHSKVDKLLFHMSMVKAAARIIAGRKLRWKRDMHLSQSMKIGPAHAGKAGGMKLTGVDRTETLREDREVAEALSIWRKQMGGFRAAIAMANRNLGVTVPFIPNISENMPVRVAKLEDGALTAPKSCFLCGLKRDERIERIDVDVQDSFGEWWTDHWGHVDCKIFWENHQVSLEQRR